MAWSTLLEHLANDRFLISGQGDQRHDLKGQTAAADARAGFVGDFDPRCLAQPPESATGGRNPGGHRQPGVGVKGSTFRHLADG